jgi:hypothetical protein
MVVLNGNKNQKVIAYKGDREPVKVFYRPKGALTPVLQENVSYRPQTSDTQDPSITYSSEYKKNLLNLSIKGGTKQIKSTGKNLIDVEKFVELVLPLNQFNAVVERDGRRCLRFYNSSMHGKNFTACCPTFKANTRYIISCDVLPNTPATTSNSLFMGFKPSPVKQIAANTTTEFTRLYVVSNASATVTDIAFSYGAATYWLIDLDTLYLYEYEGNDNPTYEPYTNRMPAPMPDYPQTINNTNNIDLYANDVKNSTINIELAENDVLTVDYINKSVGVARNTKVIELTGGETWIDNSFGEDFAYSLLLGTKEEINFDFEKPYYCTHFSNDFQDKLPVFRVEEYSNAIYLNFYYVNQTSVEEWEDWLSNQYSNGTPVIVQYSKSGIFIPDYLEVSEELKTELLSLPTTNGTNVISTNADVPTSNINITYAIWGGADE